MTGRKAFALTLLALLAFAGNSLLCRIALKTTGIDAASVKQPQTRAARPHRWPQPPRIALHGQRIANTATPALLKPLAAQVAQPAGAVADEIGMKAKPDAESTATE